MKARNIVMLSAGCLVAGIAIGIVVGWGSVPMYWFRTREPLVVTTVIDNKDVKLGVIPDGTLVFTWTESLPDSKGRSRVYAPIYMDQAIVALGLEPSQQNEQRVLGFRQVSRALELEWLPLMIELQECR
jgi:hypothetical protein